VKQRTGEFNRVGRIAGPDLLPVLAGEELPVLNIGRNNASSLLIRLIVGGYTRRESEASAWIALSSKPGD